MMSLVLLVAVAFAAVLLLAAIGAGIYFATRSKNDEEGGGD